MATISKPGIAVIAKNKYRGEALALSIARHTKRTVVPLTKLESTVLTSCLRILVESDANLEGTLKLIREVTTNHPNLVLVVLGSLESEEDIAKLGEAGACGYVPADASFKEMLTIMRTARTGEFICPPHVNHALFSWLAILTGKERICHLQSAGLTMRERQIAELLTNYHTNEEIADHLCVAKCTVKSHVHRLKKKLSSYRSEIPELTLYPKPAPPVSGRSRHSHISDFQGVA